jgi:2-dehydro-3-deoxygluconokinase
MNAGGHRADVSLVGEAMALLLAADELPLTSSRTFARSVAGSESNVAIALGRLGYRVCLSGRVGRDPAAAWVRGALQESNVCVSGLIEDPAAPTGLLVRDAPSGRKVTVSYYRHGSAGSRLSAEDLRPAEIGGSRALFMSGITTMLSESAAACAHRAAELARQNSVHFVLDPNIRTRLAPVTAWRARLAPLWPMADTIILGEAEAAALWPGCPLADLPRAAGQTIVVRMRDQTARAYTAGSPVEAAPRLVSVTDPVGAGDAFTAGWLSGWLDGRDTAQCLSRAHRLASLAVSARGDIEGLPIRADLDAIEAMDKAGADVER